MAKFSFDSEGLVVDWISFNLKGLIDTEMLAYCLSKHFTPHVLMDDVPRIGYSGLNKKYKVSIHNIRDRKVTGSELRLFALEKMRLISIRALEQ